MPDAAVCCPFPKPSGAEVPSGASAVTYSTSSNGFLSPSLSRAAGEEDVKEVADEVPCCTGRAGAPGTGGRAAWAAAA